MDKMKILIVDDHRVVIEGVKSSLRKNPEFEVTGEATDGRQAVELAKSLKPDIVIMDISMPNLSGIEAAKQIKLMNPDINIIIYTMYAEKEFVIDLFKSGVSAYILKDDPLEDLTLALSAVKAGGTYLSTMTPKVILRHLEELEDLKEHKDALLSLSRRETEVFIRLAEGNSIKEVAIDLCISPKTVETHKYNIMGKLNISSIVEFTKIAIKNNLIQI